MILQRNGYKVEIEQPTLYVDNETRKRSGHMSHAMAAWSDTSYINFNSNCSSQRWSGHSTYGWIEYRTSQDSGATYSDVQKLPYSEQCFLDGIHTISVEKAVACDDGTIVAFCLRNDATGKTCCEPWDITTVVTSSDYGKSWTSPIELCTYKGRVYDARYYNGSIYVLMLSYEYFVGVTEEHVYRVFKSDDNGKSFYEWSVLPIPGIGHAYASLLIGGNGVFHAYAYQAHEHDMLPMDHAVSNDGKNWTMCEPCEVAKGIRNPQTAYINGVYLLHGRAHDMSGLVLYTSKDGCVWDDGTMLVDKRGLAYYSSNVILSDEQGPFVLVQYSVPYMPCCVNANHMKIRVHNT